MVQLFDAMRHGRPGAAFQRLKQLNLSMSHIRALHLLAPNRTLAMKDLAEQLDMTPPSVTALTRRLVQVGLVARHTHHDDQRVALLVLTDEGRQLLTQLQAERLQKMEELLHGLTPDEQEQFVQLLERAIAALQTDDAR
jgi:DNA-binding MarR family transcriptional regulator